MCAKYLTYITSLWGIMFKGCHFTQLVGLAQRLLPGDSTRDISVKGVLLMIIFFVCQICQPTDMLDTGFHTILGSIKWHWPILAGSPLGEYCDIGVKLPSWGTDFKYQTGRWHCLATELEISVNKDLWWGYCYIFLVTVLVYSGFPENPTPRPSLFEFWTGNFASPSLGLFHLEHEKADRVLWTHCLDFCVLQTQHWSLIWQQAAPGKPTVKG